MNYRAFKALLVVKCVVNTTSYKGEPMKLSERISWLKTTIQENLFPHLRECLDDPLTEKQKDLIMILEVIEIEKYVAHLNDSWTGRPPEDRCALARSFVAKAVYNLDNTRMLIDLLHNMPPLRKICGFVQKKRYSLRSYLLPCLCRVCTCPDWETPYIRRWWISIFPINSSVILHGMPLP